MPAAARALPWRDGRPFVWAAAEFDPIIKAFAQRLSAAGKPFKVVMTACMRKLLTMLNTMVRDAQPWNPEHAQCQNNPKRPVGKQPEKQPKNHPTPLDFKHSRCSR